MSKEKSEDKKEKHEEPKLLEIEKMVASFRHIHGNAKLMTWIKSTLHENGKKHDGSTNKEPKISELEKMFQHFKESHGHKKLEQSVNEATKDINRKEIKKQPEHTIYTDASQKIKSVTSKDILRDLRNYIVSSFRFIRKKMKYKRYRYTAMAMGVFLGIYILFNLPMLYSRINWGGSEDTQKLIVRTEETVQREMADSATLAPGEVIPAESRVIIPKIGVNVPVVYANTWDEKAIQDMLHDGVVHYKDTAKPGEVGNSFITGHSSNYWWDTGKYNQAFLLIDKLEPGDQAIVYYNNKKFVYTVRDKVVVEPTDMSVVAPTATPVLSLMTCTPPGTSWKRLVVRLDRTDPAFYKPGKVMQEKVIETPKIEEDSFIEKVISIFTPG